MIRDWKYNDMNSKNTRENKCWTGIPFLMRLWKARHSQSWKKVQRRHIKRRKCKILCKEPPWLNIFYNKIEFPQYFLPYNHARAKVEVVLYDLQKLLLRHCASSICEHSYRERLSNTDGIGDLNKNTTAQFGCHKRLGNPPCCIRTRSVHLKK